jgi:hypothetical protein
MRPTIWLLRCGAIAGPLFIVVLLAQAFLVPGFDIRTDLISLLSLGPYGFVQITNFALCGLLNVFYAIGLWQRLHRGPSGTFAPIFVALHGLFLVVVAVFVTDPANGFPPGSPTPAVPSSHAIVHALGALWVFLTCAVALVVLVRFFLAGRERPWAAFCAASAALMIVLFFPAFASKTAAPFVDASLVIGWMGLSVVAMRLLAGYSRVQPKT